ncbi:XdhC family protein [Symbiobacterium terraclitae]|uniref:XdhC family protein n=1 Tax=Symbiobacterium terraclitae TaxID=557451 RepID=UPI001FDA4A45|nr:XdhC family protein [Symbiobacterium terraclitae]
MPVEDPILQLHEALQAGERVALATVVHTRGHCPREVGAKMLIWRDGRIAGSVGGGCGENRIRLAALTALDEGRPVVEQVDLLDDPALDEGAVCGGVMEVLIEPFGS